jgi:hypothetical protein
MHSVIKSSMSSAKPSGEEPARFLIEAVRYGEQPIVKAHLKAVVDATVSDTLREVVHERALVSDVMTKADVERIRKEMERAAARKLQPHFIQSFFHEAFSLLGGTIGEREPGPFEITHVPPRPAGVTGRSGLDRRCCGDTKCHVREALDRCLREAFRRARHARPTPTQQSAPRVPTQPTVAVLPGSRPTRTPNTRVSARADPRRHPAVQQSVSRRAAVALANAETKTRPAHQLTNHTKPCRENWRPVCFPGQEGNRCVATVA